jgi:transposase
VPRPQDEPTIESRYDNTIEQAFAKLKALLRSAAARTIPDLWAAIRQAFTRFTPQECRNYLAAAGYENDLAVAT